MNWRNTQDRYGSLSIGMHWLMMLLMVGVYAAINLHDAAPKGSALRHESEVWHFLLGMGVLALVAARLATRLVSGPAPRIEPAPSALQQRIGAAMHVALYAFMLGMPLLGWLAVSAKAEEIVFFGMQLPMLIGPDKPLARSIKEVHEAIGTLGYFLIGLHAVAALVHHYLMRDSTLLRMLPARR